MIDRIVSLLDAYIERDSLRSQLRCLGASFWPWDSAATLRRRLEWATAYGYPSERADARWLESVEGRMAMIELRLMRALGIMRRGGMNEDS